MQLEVGMPTRRTDLPTDQRTSWSLGSLVPSQALMAPPVSPLNSPPPHHCKGFSAGGPPSDPFAFQASTRPAV